MFTLRPMLPFFSHSPEFQVPCAKEHSLFTKSLILKSVEKLNV